MITIEQNKGARACLGWSQKDLATESEVSLKTIQNFENNRGTPNASTLQALKHALEMAGIVFGANHSVSRTTDFRGITQSPFKQGLEDEVERDDVLKDKVIDILNTGTNLFLASAGIIDDEISLNKHQLEQLDDFFENSAERIFANIKEQVSNRIEAERISRLERGDKSAEKDSNTIGNAKWIFEDVCETIWDKK